mgnify:CR=1 FL=1
MVEVWWPNTKNVNTLSELSAFRPNQNRRMVAVTVKHILSTPGFHTTLKASSWKRKLGLDRECYDDLLFVPNTLEQNI